jgi:hypothetical protein
MDETGFRIGVGRNQWVITMDWKRPQISPSDTNRDYITSVEAVSVDGEVLPPLLIIQGMDHLHQWYANTSLPDNYLVGTSKSGYSNDMLSIDWLHHFDNWSRQRQQGAWRLLIFDGYESHLTKEFIEYCDDKKIIPFGLPPHTSHHLQLLDVVIFQPLNTITSRLLNRLHVRVAQTLIKLNFLMQFTQFVHQHLRNVQSYWDGSRQA